MEGKLTFDFVPTPYTFDPKHKRALDLQTDAGKTRTAANRISWVDTEEVAALVIDNGYVSPRQLDSYRQRLPLKIAS